MPSVKPSDERISTLATLQLLAQSAGASLDRLTELTAYVFDAPVAFVSVIEDDRQRLVSRVGLSLTETRIDDSICSHSLGSPDVMVVRDLREDARFRRNPLVVNPPFLRFYAGAPLVAENGVAIGALCLMDREVREFSADDCRQLDTLSKAVMNQIELRGLAGRLEPVSGLPNRRQFSDDYAGVARRSEGGHAYAVLIDILDLGRANEAGQVLGMHPLEALVRRSGVRLRSALDGLANVYHVGATRFAFMVDLPTADRVEALIEQLRGRMTRPLTAASVPMSPLFHAGACAVDFRRDSADDVIRKTLIGLHEAVAAQRAFCWYSDQRDEAMKRNYRLAADAARALREHEFHLVYQPRFRTGDLDMVAAEALVRWQHPELGAIGPAEFIPVLERTAVMKDLSAWIVDSALDQLSRFRRISPGFGVSINLSARDFADPDAAVQLIAKIASHALPAHAVEIEITEGEWLRSDSVAAQQIAAMSAAGIRIAIDDFGSGYSNFGYLTGLPIHALKLDKSMIDQLDHDAREQLKVQAIIALARGLGYSTVAEGVETRAQLDRLRALGCDELQGFLLSRPLPAADLEERLSRLAPAVPQ